MGGCAASACRPGVYHGADTAATSLLEPEPLRFEARSACCGGGFGNSEYSKTSASSFATGPVVGIHASPGCAIGLMDGLSPPAAAAALNASPSTCSSSGGWRSTASTRTPDPDMPSCPHTEGTNDVDASSAAASREETARSPAHSIACEALAGGRKAWRLEDLQQVFNSFHREPLAGVKAIMTEDLGKVLAYMGNPQTEEDLKLLIEEADSDGGGSLDFDEFLNLAKTLGVMDDSCPQVTHAAASSDSSKPMTQQQKAVVRRLFNEHGNGEGGSLLTSDLGKVMAALGRSLSDEELQNIIARADEDGSGSLDFDEFLPIAADLINLELLT